MMKISKRLLELTLPANRSAFLWGPRKTGKSYWVAENYPNHRLIDLLKSDVFADYAARPVLLREQAEAWFPGASRPKEGPHIIIDEIQKIPALLDEIHWLIENRSFSFLLTGSSAAKLRRSHANLLGGRAWRRVMLPLSYHEIEGFEMAKAMASGLLPPHLLSPNPREDLRAYLADYLRDEIAAEASERDLPAFSQFLHMAALTSSQLLDYTHVAAETGISAAVVRRYFELLEDTFLGFRIPPWRASKKRRMILTEKFYLFDVGVAQFLARRTPTPGSPDFGKAFEHFILMELRAFLNYRALDKTLTFWRTSTGMEVDFILGEKELAIEIKSSAHVHDKDLRGMRALREDGGVKNSVVVCMEKEIRRMAGGIDVMPWEVFLKDLWGDRWLS